MNFKNSILVLLFVGAFMLSALCAVDTDLVIVNQQIDEERKNAIPLTSYFENFIAELSTLDPIKRATLPTLRMCRGIYVPLKIIFFESPEAAAAIGANAQGKNKAFLPFYTNFWCTGVHLSIAVLAEILYIRRDCQKHNCSIDDENHRRRVACFMKNTHFFLQNSQEFIESEINRRRNLIAKYAEIVLDGAILFLESLYDNENDSLH